MFYIHLSCELTRGNASGSICAMWQEKKKPITEYKQSLTRNMLIMFLNEKHDTLL